MGAFNDAIFRLGTSLLENFLPLPSLFHSTDVLSNYYFLPKNLLATLDYK